MRRQPIKEIDGFVCVGIITDARGIKGEVRIKSFTGDPSALGSYGPLRDEDGSNEFELKVTGHAKGLLSAKIKGVDDRSGAEALKGAILYLDCDLLPAPEEDEFYYADLIGLRAELIGVGAEKKEGSGFVAQVHDFGAGCVLEVEGLGKGTVMVPFTKAVVPEVNMTEGRLSILPPPGLLDPAKPEDEDGQDEKGLDA